MSLDETLLTLKLSRDQIAVEMQVLAERMENFHVVELARRKETEYLVAQLEQEKRKLEMRHNKILMQEIQAREKHFNNGQTLIQERQRLLAEQYNKDLHALRTKTEPAILEPTIPEPSIPEPATV